ncbi:MAG TPA: DUF418 domain-containing protein [Pseudonocardiaceae bacterium]|jgi:uncharacterized protein|nr:DUF418 domain-containing protein [Pseudonocardiaceae bacterium]
MSPSGTRTAQPVSGRIEVLDVLRGMAILGTLGTNIWLFTDPLGPAVVFSGLPSTDSATDTVATVLRFLTNGKFLALLTLLFGVGLELQYQSARRRGTPWPGRYLWRAALLFVEGVLHYLLVFEFDVLMSYAVTAMIVAWLIGRSDRAVRAWMIAMGALHVGVVGLLTVALVAAPPSTSVTPVSFPTGSWTAQVADRIALAGLYRAEAVFIIPLGIVLFLAGSRLLRAGALADDDTGRRIRRGLIAVGLGVAAPVNLLTGFAGPDWFLVDRYLLPPIVAAGLLGLVTTLVYRLGAVPGLLRTGTNAVGRSALSCYVFQNLVASVLCYGWGLGLAARFAELRPWWVIAAWAGICALFMALAVGWLRRFDRGPLELAWHWAYRAPQRHRELPVPRRIDPSHPGSRAMPPGGRRR